MSNTTNIPHSALKAFPLLHGATFTQRLSAPVPLVPDTVFDIFKDNSGCLFTLVTTDYPDPLDQSEELKEISNLFEFMDLVKPYRNSERGVILEHDDMDGTFVIAEGNAYYYLASTRNLSNPED
jgi:hypothetical protein